MSHFTVCVVVGTVPIKEAEERVDEMLAPYSENLEVEPYRDYETLQQRGASVAAAAPELVAERVGPRPDISALRAEMNSLRRKVESDDDPRWVDVDRRWREWLAADEAYEARVGRAFPAAEAAKIVNDRWGHPGPDRVLVDPEPADEGGRTFTMSTYNPKSKWDWYSVGGRWSGQLRVRPRAEAVVGEPGVFGLQEPLAEDQADVARVGDVTNLAEVSCFALLTPEGWEEAARIGWWAVTLDRTMSEEDWKRHVTEVLTGLPENAVIAMVDCHI